MGTAHHKMRSHRSGLGRNARERLEGQVGAHDATIDELVYTRYGLTAEDIRVVEDATKK